MDAGTQVAGLSDAELIAQVRSGDTGAYGELYARHVAAARALAREYAPRQADADDIVSDAFARMLQTLQAGNGPDLFFRAYLFTTVRRIAYRMSQVGQRTEPVDDFTSLDTGVDFDDPAVAGFEKQVVRQAFSSLPERWQAALWYTEVEGMPPSEVGPILGMSANGVAALAYRAREGLRQAYLQQHLAQVDGEDCERFTDKLGAYARGGLSRRESAKVEEHLAGCDRCRSMVLELADINHGMRAFIGPMILGVAGASALIGAAVGVGSSVAAGAATGGVVSASTTAASSPAVASGATSGGAATGSASGGAGGGAAGAGAAASGAAAAGSSIGVVAAVAASVAVLAVAAGAIWATTRGGSPTGDEATPPVVSTAPAEPSASADTQPSDAAQPDDEATNDVPDLATEPDEQQNHTAASDSDADVYYVQVPVQSPAGEAQTTPTAEPTPPTEPSPGPTPGPTSEPTPGPTSEPTPSPTIDPTPPVDPQVPTQLSVNGTLTPGFRSGLAISAANTGPSVLKGVAATIDLPPGVTLASPVAASDSGLSGREALAGIPECTAELAAARQADYVCDLGDLAPGETRTFQLALIVAPTVNPGDLPVTVTMSAVGHATTTTELTLMVTAPTEAGVGVSLLSPVSFSSGERGEIQVGLENTGGASAGAITVRIPLPVWATVAGDLAADGLTDCQENGGMIECTASDFAADATATVRIPVAVQALDSSIDTVPIEVTARGRSDSTPVEMTVLSPKAEIAISPASVDVSADTTLMYVDISALPGTGTFYLAKPTVMVLLPEGATLRSGQIDEWQCSGVGNLVTCTASGLVGGSLPGIVLPVKFDPNVTGATSVFVTLDAAEIATAQVKVPLTMTSSDTSRYAITMSAYDLMGGASGSITVKLQNNSASMRTSVRAEFTLPAGIAFAGSSWGEGWSCTPSGRVVACHGADLARSESSEVSIKVSVDPSLSGTHQTIAVRGRSMLLDNTELFDVAVA